MDLTCLALHPKEDCIATGAINGKIILWYNYLACMRDKNKVNNKMDVDEEDDDEDEDDEDESKSDESNLINGTTGKQQVSDSDDNDDSDDSDTDDDEVKKRKKLKQQQQQQKSKINKVKKPNQQQQQISLVTKPTKSILHWHSLPVISLKFTPEGSFLLSGGHECVLVKWFYKTGQKDFRPRLGSPIADIFSSADNTIYVTRHLDNCMFFCA